jgi:hypothetical protein
MYRIAFDRKRDPVRQRALPDRIFFACGACHILAHAFLQRHPKAGGRAVRQKPDAGFTANNVFVADDGWVFGYQGYSEVDRFLARARGKARRWWQGWSATLVDLPTKVLVSEAKSLRYDGRWLSEPERLLHDALPRARAFVDRFPTPPPCLTTLVIS